uniref:Transposase n=1 Tax=Acrobeloides nanus TaxID=290746 RepID=A0A914CRW9_9BILA
MGRVIERLNQPPFKVWSSRHKLYFLRDNARPHAAALTQDRLFDLNWAIVPHASYRLDKFPCDYTLFRYMEHDLSGKVFEDEDDVHEFLKK